MGRERDSGRKTTPPVAEAIKAGELASLIEQLARKVNALRWTGNMQAAQWSALRYFARAEPRARTVLGLSRFQGTNAGTASRTVAVLMRRALLSVTIPPEDRRIRLLSLTDQAWELLRSDPLLQVETAIAQVPPEQRIALGNGLAALLEQLSERPRGESRPVPSRAAPSPEAVPAADPA